MLVESSKSQEQQQESQVAVDASEAMSLDEEGKESDTEEKTYVLPADIEEWQKLFELVESEKERKTLTPEEEETAGRLLAFRDDILNIEIEKQLEIFVSLCKIGNVQIT